MKALLEVELLHPGTVSQAEAGEREVRLGPGGQERLVGGLQGQQLVERHLAGLEGGQDVLDCLDGGGGGGGAGAAVLGAAARRALLAAAARAARHVGLARAVRRARRIVAEMCVIFLTP